MLFVEYYPRHQASRVLSSPTVEVDKVRRVICGKCQGHGGRVGAKQKCSTCRGTGVQVRIFQLGPGILTQSQSICAKCNGECEVIPAKDLCKTCKGRKYVHQRKKVQVHIDKGMKDGQKIVFSGEGEQECGIPAGDLIVVLEEEEHPVFTRKGTDLIMRIELELAEALCGFRKSVETLDGRHLSINVLPGEVIKQGDLRCVPGEGMPRYKNPFDKGQLIIQFLIHFPSNNFITAEKLSQLESLLPPKRVCMVPPNAREALLVETDPSRKSSGPSGVNRRTRRNRTAAGGFVNPFEDVTMDDDDDDEDEDAMNGANGIGGVACHPQ